jgi:hypothetical protein
MSLPSDENQAQVQVASRLLYFCPQFERGLTPRAYQMLIMRRPDLRQLDWSLRQSPARDVQQAIRDRAAVAQLDFDAWTAGLTKP